MSLLKKLENEAEFILSELKSRMLHQRQTYGAANEKLEEMVEHLENHLATQLVPENAPVATPIPAVVAAPVEDVTPVVTIDTPVSAGAEEAITTATPVSSN